jgi:hypothetical protein
MYMDGAIRVGDLPKYIRRAVELGICPKNIYMDGAITQICMDGAISGLLVE